MLLQNQDINLITICSNMNLITIYKPKCLQSFAFLQNKYKFVEKLLQFKGGINEPISK